MPLSLAFIFSKNNLIKVALAVVTFVSFAWVFSWQFALVAMISVGVHESGHIWAYKHYGMKTKGFYFLPMVGGAAITTTPYSSCWSMAIVAMMGPLAGGILGVWTMLLYLIIGAPILAASAYWMFFFNLLNLIPIVPLDGVKVLKAITMGWSYSGRMIVWFLSAALGVWLTMHLGWIVTVVFMMLVIGDYGVERRRRERDLPRLLTGKELSLSMGMYVLMVLVMGFDFYSMSHIPGGGIAENFFPGAH